jgi:CopG family nickel-responsive transcriptional regulator
MAGVVRFGVSLEGGLLERFDALNRRRRYANRSEAVRDLIRDRLVEDEWRGGRAQVVGTLSLVYDHEAMDLAQKLTHLQHGHLDVIVTSLHVHLDHHHCLEVLVLRGRGSVVRKISDERISTRGVKHGQQTVASTGRKLG